MIKHGVVVVCRLCWVIAVCLSVAACTNLIYNVYYKWVTSPVIVSFAETTTAVSSIPFPAVTICSGNRVRKTVFDYEAAFLNINGTTEEFEKVGFSSLMCPRLGPGHAEIVDDRAIKFVEQVGTPLSDMVLRCRLRNKDKPCEKIFSSFLTDAGLCHVFNMVNAREIFTENVDEHLYINHLNHNHTSASWSLEKGYTSQDASFPFRAFSSGSKEGLMFRYWEKSEDLSDTCGFPAFGFKLLVHSPVDFPEVNTQYFRVAPGQDVVVSVTANVMSTSRGLRRNLTPDERQCYQSHERQLHFFKIYTEANCEFECFINASLQICNCSAFYMPRARNTPICGGGSTTCLNYVYNGLSNQEGSEVSSCHCLPSCTDIQYDVEVSQSDVQWDKAMKGTRRNKNLKVGRISVYFKRNKFITSKRSELYGKTDFIANCGGLLGLFLGFSFLSLVEVIYFLLMRPAVRLVRSFRKWNEDRTL